MEFGTLVCLRRAENWEKGIISDVGNDGNVRFAIQCYNSKEMIEICVKRSQILNLMCQLRLKPAIDSKNHSKINFSTINVSTEYETLLFKKNKINKIMKKTNTIIRIIQNKSTYQNLCVAIFGTQSIAFPNIFCFLFVFVLILCFLTFLVTNTHFYSYIQTNHANLKKVVSPMQLNILKPSLLLFFCVCFFC